MPLQDLGTSVDRDDVVVAAAMDGLSDHYPADVWSLPNPALLSHFETIVDFGGRRLALATKRGGCSLWLLPMTASGWLAMTR